MEHSSVFQILKKMEWSSKIKPSSNNQSTALTDVKVKRPPTYTGYLIALFGVGFGNLKRAYEFFDEISFSG